MHIESEIELIVAKIKEDKNFASGFSSDPIKAVRLIVGKYFPDDQIEPLIEGVKAKIT